MDFVLLKMRGREPVSGDDHADVRISVCQGAPVWHGAGGKVGCGRGICIHLPVQSFSLFSEMHVCRCVCHVYAGTRAHVCVEVEGQLQASSPRTLSTFFGTENCPFRLN